MMLSIFLSLIIRRHHNQNFTIFDLQKGKTLTILCCYAHRHPLKIQSKKSKLILLTGNGNNYQEVRKHVKKIRIQEKHCKPM
jgi:hypothetical protein